MGISKAYPLMRPMKSVGPAPKSCQWIEGDDGTKCGEPVVIGKPYWIAAL